LSALHEMLDEIEAEINNPGTFDDIEAVWSNVYSLTMDSASRDRLTRLERRWDTMYERSIIVSLVNIVNSLDDCHSPVVP
jgi:hypothetical protein